MRGAHWCRAEQHTGCCGENKTNQHQHHSTYFGPERGWRAAAQRAAAPDTARPWRSSYINTTARCTHNTQWPTDLCRALNTQCAANTAIASNRLSIFRLLHWHQPSQEAAAHVGLSHCAIRAVAGDANRSNSAQLNSSRQPAASKQWMGQTVGESARNGPTGAQSSRSLSHSQRSAHKRRHRNAGAFCAAPLRSLLFGSVLLQSISATLRLALARPRLCRCPSDLHYGRSSRQGFLLLVRCFT